MFGSFKSMVAYRTGPRHPKLRLWVKPQGEKARLYETTDMTLAQALREGRTMGRAMVEVK